MGSIVTANSRRPEETAIGLVGKESVEVTITDETGRVFQNAEFAQLFRAGPRIKRLKFTQ
jgi:hypothetical protein